jgi:hypothetical protein
MVFCNGTKIPSLKWINLGTERLSLDFYSSVVVSFAHEAEQKMPDLIVPPMHL